MRTSANRYAVIDARGEPTRYGFCCGYTLTVSRRAGTATISRENGAYIVRRHPGHPAGWLIVPCRTLTAARRVAAAMAAGKTPAAPA